MSEFLRQLRFGSGDPSAEGKRTIPVLNGVMHRFGIPAQPSEILYRAAREFVKASTQVERWHRCDTALGPQCVELLLRSNGRRIGVEIFDACEHPPACYAQRDAALIKAQVLDAVYRVRGEDLSIATEHVLHLLMRLERHLFRVSPRAILRRICRQNTQWKDYRCDGIEFPRMAIRCCEISKKNGQSGGEGFSLAVSFSERDGRR